jgi:hypothetical protein
MRALVARLLLVALLVALVPVGVLLATGELYVDLDEPVARAVRGAPTLVGFRFDETPYWSYKLRVLRALPRRDVVAVGSSRVLQLRAEMFPRASFYNAGYTADSVKDLRTVLSLIPDDRLPRTLLVGLDPWMFNARYDDLAGGKRPADLREGPEVHWSLVRTEAGAIHGQLLDGALEVRRLAACGSGPVWRVGFNACVNDTGFRTDGSMRYGKQVERLLRGDAAAADFAFSDTLRRIRDGNRRFEYGDAVNAAALAELRAFLDACRARGVRVVGFLAPLPDAVLRAMTESGRYGYLGSLRAALPAVFREEGFEYHDLLAFSAIGASDDEALDGFHGSEVVYARALALMLSAGSELNAFCDAPGLATALARRPSRLELYAGTGEASLR